EHLTGCRICMAAYVDAVQLRHHWRHKAAEPPPASADSKKRRSPQVRLWLLAACIPLLIIAGAWFFLPEPDTDLENLDPAFGQVAVAVAAASHEGMIPPGTAGAEWNRGSTVYRSGENHSTELSEALLVLHDLPEEDYPPSLLYLKVAGHLANDDLQMARILVNNEIGLDTDDPNILLLKGVVEYLEGNLAESEKFLNKSLAIQPKSHEARFNLALLLAETNHPDEAREIFEDLVLLEAYPLLHNRARLELDQLDN
ncbi:MAG: tetratricopeptide repeat protein, partial [Candidatus Krumholzibacteriota bacterium]